MLRLPCELPKAFCQYTLKANMWPENTVKLRIFLLTIRSNGSCVLAALSSSSLYSSSSHSLCSVLSGSLSCTGIVTLERSLPMLFLRMFHRLMLLLLGLGEGRQDLRWQRTAPSSAEPGNTCQMRRLKALNVADNDWTSTHSALSQFTWVLSVALCLVTEVIHGNVVANVTDVWIILGCLKKHKNLTQKLRDTNPPEDRPWGPGSLSTSCQHRI